MADADAISARSVVVVLAPVVSSVTRLHVAKIGVKVPLMERRPGFFSSSWLRPFMVAITAVARQIASLTSQCRQVYCLVEMAPSAPSWRPPRNGVSSTASQAGENDQTNVATQQSFQAFSTHPTLRRSRRRRTAPSDPSLIQPSG